MTNILVAGNVPENHLRSFAKVMERFIPDPNFVRYEELPSWNDARKEREAFYHTFDHVIDQGRSIHGFGLDAFPRDRNAWIWEYAPLDGVTCAQLTCRSATGDFRITFGKKIEVTRIVTEVSHEKPQGMEPVTSKVVTTENWFYAVPLTNEQQRKLDELETAHHEAEETAGQLFASACFEDADSLRRLHDESIAAFVNQLG